MNANSISMARIREAFERASSLVRAGDLSMAEHTLREALQDFPNENSLSCLLGAVLVRARRPSEAETILRQVVARVPDFAKAHEELANALLAQNLPEAAVPSLEKSLALEPANTLAARKLYEVRTALGESPSEAGGAALSEIQEKLLKVELHRSRKQFREAEALCQEILAKQPDNAAVYQRLGQLALEQGHFADARVILKRAVALQPDNVGAWLELGTANLELDLFDEAERALESAIEIEPGASLLHQTLGGIFSRSGQYDKAIAALESALELQNDNVGALLALGHALRTIGRHDDAVATYRRLVDSQPGNGEAYWSLANLKRYEFSRRDVDAMLQQLEEQDIEDDTRVFFCFALGKAFEDLEEFDRAFEFFERGNTVRRKSESYDPVEAHSLTDSLASVFDQDLLGQAESAVDATVTPIFIVGLPRSGSTLVEQILASHSQVDGTRELATLERIVRSLDSEDGGGSTYPEAVAKLDTEHLAALGRRYLSATTAYRDDSPFFTDKMPGNFRHIGLIKRILPHARIIDMRRHPLDSCMGCFKQLFASGQPYAYDLFELGEYYLEYDRLMRHWQALLPDEILTLHYEDLISDPPAQIARLLGFCGLAMEESCLNFHETSRPIESASSEQVRQPIYSTSVGHWRNYERQISELVETLRPVLGSASG